MNKGFLTEGEKRVVQHLADAWNEFVKQPVEHPDDISEFKDAIHRAQNLIAYRVAKRAEPEVFK